MVLHVLVNLVDVRLLFDESEHVNRQRFLVDEVKLALPRTENGKWETIYRRKTVGKMFGGTFEPVDARYVRLNMLDADKGPTISQIWWYGSEQ